MDKLTDPNPYEILNIKPDSDRKTIKRALADRQRENKTQAERQQALQARNALFSTEKRLITDALTPTSLMPDSVRDSDLKLSDSRHQVDWQDIADPDEILQDAVSALIAATIWRDSRRCPGTRHTYRYTDRLRRIGRVHNRMAEPMTRAPDRTADLQSECRSLKHELADYVLQVNAFRTTLHKAVCDASLELTRVVTYRPGKSSSFYRQKLDQYWQSFELFAERVTATDHQLSIPFELDEGLHRCQWTVPQSASGKMHSICLKSRLIPSSWENSSGNTSWL